MARPLVTEGEVAELLAGAIGPDAPARVFALICGQGGSPLRGLISGSLDLDKIEYLKRDALMCGVPYGEIDVDRLLNALVLVDDPQTGRLAVGLREKGLSALESLLFAKYQMYRNVYWHHAVRAAPRPSSPRSAGAGCTSARSSARPRSSTTRSATGSWPTGRSRWRWRTGSRRTSGSPPASCCSTTRRRRRCSASTCRCCAAGGPSSA
jgi:hypothetical protein